MSRPDLVYRALDLVDCERLVDAGDLILLGQLSVSGQRVCRACP